jgi:hypothetical protein
MFMCIDRHPPMVLINQGKMFMCIDRHLPMVLINQYLGLSTPLEGAYLYT